MRLSSYVVLASMAGGLAACKSPGAEYRFSAAQLAWQPYKEGMVLRFGNGRTSAVRTYRVVQVLDEMETYQGFLVSFSERPKYEHLAVTVQRTDTSAAAFTVLDMLLDSDPGVGSVSQPVLQTRVEWDNSPAPYTLPIEEANSGAAIDTSRYSRYGRVALLPSVMLGPTTYGQVLQAQAWGTPAPKAWIYYAKNKGLVAFEEPRLGLWYQLP